MVGDELCCCCLTSLHLPVIRTKGGLHLYLEEHCVPSKNPYETEMNVATLHLPLTHILD